MANDVRGDGPDDRGRQAEHPKEISARGWRDILLRVKRQIGTDNISLIAASIAYYGLLAIPPALVALVSVYGLVANPSEVQGLLDSVSGAIPAEARKLIESQLQRIVTSSGEALSVGVVLGFLLALWSTASATKALMGALNIVYNEQEKRGFVRRTATALLLTLAGFVGAALFLGLVVGLPAVLHFAPVSKAAKLAVSVVRWPLLLVTVAFALSVLYRYGPSRARPRWRWVTWGSAVAVALWLIVSILFSLYVSHFGSYNKTYGSLAAVVILLLWMYIGAYVVLLGAELDAEMEHQTIRDSTVGPPKPMGTRGAYMADTLGETPA